VVVVPLPYRPESLAIDASKGRAIVAMAAPSGTRSFAAVVDIRAPRAVAVTVAPLPALNPRAVVAGAGRAFVIGNGGGGEIDALDIATGALVWAARDGQSAPFDPCLIYLYQDDMARSLRWVCDHRGATIEHTYIQQVEESAYGKRRGLASFDGLAAYWTAYREITDATFSAIGWTKLAIETSVGAWHDYRCQALGFLDLPRIDDGVDVAEDLERFVGLYRSVDNDPSIACTVSLKEGSLLLDGLPEVWPHARLLPKAPSVFDVASLPIEVSFEADAAEDTVTMTVVGPHLFGGEVVGTFRAVLPGFTLPVADVFA